MSMFIRFFSSCAEDSFMHDTSFWATNYEQTIHALLFSHHFTSPLLIAWRDVGGTYYLSCLRLWYWHRSAIDLKLGWRYTVILWTLEHGSVTARSGAREDRRLLVVIIDRTGTNFYTNTNPCNGWNIHQILVTWIDNVMYFQRLVKNL